MSDDATQREVERAREQLAADIDAFQTKAVDTGKQSAKVAIPAVVVVVLAIVLLRRRRRA